MSFASEQKEDTPFLTTEDEELSRLRRTLRSRGKSLVVALIALVLSNLLLLSSMAYLHLRPTPPSNLPSYENGFTTEYEPAAPAINLITSVANGRIAFNPRNGSLSLHHDPSQPRYFAPPSPSVDSEWATLMSHEFFSFPSSELTHYPAGLHGYPATAELKRDPGTQAYQMELGVYHSLHCLNAVRQALYPDYYPPEQEGHGSYVPHGWNEVHLEHCLENLFHAVTCHADLTPVPVWKFPGLMIRLGVAGEHTCRDFGRVKEWMKDRRELKFDGGETDA